MRHPSSPLRWSPLAAYLVLGACFFTDSPVFTRDQLVATPDRDRYHETLVVPDDWATAAFDPKTANERVGSTQAFLLVDGATVRRHDLDLWSEELGKHPDDWRVARVEDREYLIMDRCIVDHDGGQHQIEPFYRIRPGKDGAPDAAGLLDEPWLEEHLVGAWQEVQDDPRVRDKLSDDSKAMLASLKKHGLSFTVGRETIVRGRTAKLQAFMADEDARIFRIGHALRQRTPELLHELRVQAAPRREAFLQWSLDQAGVSSSTHREILALESHVEAVPGLAERVARLKGHAKFPRLEEAVGIVEAMNTRRLGAHLGRSVIANLLPDWELSRSKIDDWSLHGDSLRLYLGLGLKGPGRKEGTMRFTVDLRDGERFINLQYSGAAGVEEALNAAGHDKLEEDHRLLKVLLEALRGAALAL